MRSVLRWLAAFQFAAAGLLAWMTLELLLAHAHFGAPLLQRCASARTADVLRDCEGVRRQIAEMSLQYVDAALYLGVGTVILAVAATCLFVASFGIRPPAVDAR
jgi:hypothetical protein